jgi:hypothetical protein
MPALPDGRVDQGRNEFNSRVLKTFSKTPDLRNTARLLTEDEARMS